MFQLPTKIYIKNKGKKPDSSVQYLFRKLQEKVIFISNFLNSINSSQNTSIDTIHSTLQNEIQTYKTTLNNFLTLHLSGCRPTSVRDTRFHLMGAPLKALAEVDAATFLGAQVGFHIISSKATIAEITDIGLKILRSKLAPW